MKTKPKKARGDRLGFRPDKKQHAMVTATLQYSYIGKHLQKTVCQGAEMLIFEAVLKCVGYTTDYTPLILYIQSHL